MKLLFVDLETSGLNPRQHAIIQLSGIVEIENVIVDRFDYKIRPHDESAINDKTMEFHKKNSGLTKDDFEHEDYLPHTEVYKSFSSLLQKHVNKFDRSDKFQLVGYNLQVFDMPFLFNFFERNGDRYFYSYFFSPGLDVMQLAAFALYKKRSSMPNFKQMSVAQALNIDIDENRLHEAVYDIELTKRIMRRCISILNLIDAFPSLDWSQRV